MIDVSDISVMDAMQVAAGPVIDMFKNEAGLIAAAILVAGVCGVIEEVIDRIKERWGVDER